ncbi:BamA/TamA family outer membrane protein [Thalassotalea sp. PLHSN55]|uniref:BamA/TamA family outer membrane protein n=1 Tax=Thalassotalea sp. PLHSN55 TaxID=3435888 RepID=UPI003F860CB1
MKKSLLFTLTVLLSCNEVIANQFIDPIDGMFDASQYLSENAYGFLPVPIIISDPAVDGGLGMMGLFFHEDEAEKDARMALMKSKDSDAGQHLLPPSISAGFGAYTGNDSYFIGGGHLGFFQQGKIRYMGGGGYGDVNLDFYGIGDIALTKPLQLNTQATVILQSLKFKLGDSAFYLGPSQRYINADIAPSNIDDFLNFIPPLLQEKLSELLHQKVTTSGLGFSIEYDTRNNFFSPNIGLKYELNHYWFNEAIGSDINYQLTEFEALHYFHISDKWFGGIKAELQYANSDELLPPYATPTISMRGIPSGRYQANAVALTEFELSYQINQRWQTNVFAGAGKINNEFNSLFSSGSKVSKGIGFRYLIARRYGFKMGVDLAKGPEENVVYIQAGSAW